MKIYTLFFIFIFFNISCGLGQDFMLDLYKPQKDIPAEQIKSIVQDAKGFMLLLTQKGIYRFDGISSKLLISQTSIADAKSFYKTNTGKIIILFKQGLYELNETIYSSSVIDLKLLIQCDNPIQVHQENTHTLWVSLASGEVIRYYQQNPFHYRFENQGIKKHFLISEAKVIGLVSENGLVYQFKYKRFHSIKQIDATQVNTVMTPEKNIFWLATEKGIVSIDLSSPTFINSKIPNSPNDINSFYAFQKDKILIGTQNQGLYQVNTSFKELIFFHLSIQLVYIFQQHLTFSKSSKYIQTVRQGFGFYKKRAWLILELNPFLHPTKF